MTRGGSESRNLVTLFEQKSEEHAARPVFVGPTGSRTYRELSTAARRLASGLARHCPSPGAHVAILAPDGADYAAALFGTLLSGSVAVPLDTRLHPRELTALLAVTRCAAVIEAPNMPRARLPEGSVRLALGELLAAPEARRSAAPNEHDPAVILCTSGSTRSPKAVLLSHAGLYENRRAFTERYPFRPDDVVLTTLSLCHSFGLTACLLSAIGSGAALSLVDEALPGRVAAIAAATRATRFVAVASLYKYLVRSAACGASDLRTIETFLSGACALERATAECFEQKFARPIVQTYGLTEASPVVTANPPEDNRLGTVGTALEGIELRTIDAQGNPAPEGELCVRGENVMLGYYANRAATEECLARDGWLCTGDLASLDPDGYVILRGRSKDLIIRAGAKIFPDEIEEALHEHPGVAEAAVVGMPDVGVEEVPVAFIVASQAGAPEVRELSSFCRERMASFKVPRQFRFLSELPRSPNGKVLRRTLRVLLERSDPRQRRS